MNGLGRYVHGLKKQDLHDRQVQESDMTLSFGFIAGELSLARNLITTQTKMWKRDCIFVYSNSNINHF